MSALYNSRDIVEDFLRHRLQQDGRVTLPPRRHHAALRSTSTSSLTWRAVRVMTSQRDSHPDLTAVLRSACDDLAHRYHGDLAANLSALLQRDGVEAAGLGGLTAVREELFRDGVNWGRIVAMMEVGGAVCSEAVKTGGARQVEVIAGWMEEGLDSLQGWIDDNGGWVGCLCGVVR
ncbi:apoptosis regulator Bcl-2-like isoform X2 [Labrus mixtus]|uniref:apoptosis regulator Bcl-2-like isoform X2 n=1 Tax=Labrus mixtus TaxID=508554 RepID=UPI0029C023C6|nr:apoptosis regulator Bcl-2-like isoform X2 [Labrus mixtus]